MHRRRFLKLAGFASAAAASASLSPLFAHAQGMQVRFADMHTHLGVKGELPTRDAMLKYGMLIVAENVVPDSSVTRHERRGIQTFRDAAPGELRRNFESAIAARRLKAARAGLREITSVDTLDGVLAERTPGIVYASEGADFLENDIAYLETARARGIVQLQLVHYYSNSGVGDISTEAPTHDGLTPFGQDVVRACNRLGVLVDVAHATSAGIAQALDISTKPLIYSHGHVSQVMPAASQGVIAARAIYAPLAKKLCEKGGVVGLWPLGTSYGNLSLYCDELARLVDVYGVEHVGIGTDMFGLPRTIIPGYKEFSELPEYLTKRGMNNADIDAVLGGNYAKVLRQALAV